MKIVELKYDFNVVGFFSVGERGWGSFVLFDITSILHGGYW